MPANTSPIFPRTPQTGRGGAVLGPSANTVLDGSGANAFLIFTADATEGSRIDRVILKAVGSPAATVARLFLCSDTGTFTPGTTNTAANSTLIDEVALPLITVSQTAATPLFEFALARGTSIEASYKLFVTFGTSTGAAGTGYHVTVFGGRY